MPATREMLIDFFKMSYMNVFSTTDLNTIEFLEGLEMLNKWFDRTDFSTFTVLSCEVKENFPIKTSIGEIPFNYIWDRHDQLDEGIYRVVDYKTNRWGLNPQDLLKKLQARAYGLAAQIKYPQAERIYVQFDMLRHEGPVGIVFSRDDNIATWRHLKAEAERIIATPDDEAPETLNAECLFCPRSTECEALQKNIEIGGVLSTAADPQRMVDIRAQLEWQKKAVSSAIEKLDAVIIERAKLEDVIEFESELNLLRLGVSSQRAIDAERAEKVLPAEVASQYMGKTLTIASVTKLLKGNELTDEQKNELLGLIYFKKGEPRVNVQTKNPIVD